MSRQRQIYNQLQIWKGTVKFPIDKKKADAKQAANINKTKTSLQ